MRDKMAMTENVRRFIAASRGLGERSVGIEGMAVLWGDPGEGKSTAVAHVCNMMDGVFLRAGARWTTVVMLRALMVELGGESSHQCDPMIQAAVEHLSRQPRPIFVDEADYLFRTGDMLDVLRDIYDISGSSVILIGMEDFARKVQKRGKFARRITQWVEFSGINLADTRTVADELCEVQITEDLLTHVHQAARANIGRMLTAFSRIEQMGRINNLSSVSLKEWGDKPLFYDQPRFSKKGIR